MEKHYRSVGKENINTHTISLILNVKAKSLLFKGSKKTAVLGDSEVE
jgi:hypothetical protein